MVWLAWAFIAIGAVFFLSIVRQAGAAKRTVLQKVSVVARVVAGVFVLLIGIGGLLSESGSQDTAVTQVPTAQTDTTPKPEGAVESVPVESPAVLFLQAALAGEVEPGSVLEGGPRVARIYRDLPDEVKAASIEIYSLPDHPGAYNYRLFGVRVPIAEFLALDAIEPTADTLYEHVSGPLGTGLLQRNRTASGQYYSFRTAEYVIHGQPDLARLLPQ